MELAGLSTDQAPPIAAPVRFFLTAPLFGILAGLLIFFSDAQTLMNRHSIEAIVIPHAITIGFLSFIIKLQKFCKRGKNGGGSKEEKGRSKS